MDSLTAGLEDYLEIICNLSKTNENIKAVDISRKMNISRAATSEALMKLADKKLILYEGHKGITITPEGIERASKVIVRHNTFSSFFEFVLGLDNKISEENACRMEHIITDEVYERIKSFYEYCLKNKEFTEKFKEKYRK